MCSLMSKNVEVLDELLDSYIIIIKKWSISFGHLSTVFTKEYMCTR